VKLGVTLFARGTPRLFSIIDVHDLIRGVVESALHPNGEGQIFNFAGNGVISWQDLHELIGFHTFHRAYGSLIPLACTKWMMAALAKALEIAHKVFHTSQSFLNQSKIAEATAVSQVASAAKARRILGWRPQYSIPATVIRTGQWFLAQGWL